MMRIQAAIDPELRGKVEKYARDNDTTMPQAYAELIEGGLHFLERNDENEYEEIET